MLKHNFFKILLVGFIILPAIAEEATIQCNIQFNLCIDQCLDDNEKCFEKCETALENCYVPEEEDTEFEDDNESMTS